MDGRNDTIPRMLHHWATHQPDTAAFVFVDSAMNRRVLSRADVYRLASRYAAILRRGDVRRGDVVCNTLLNSPERVVSDLGIILTGAVALNGQLFLADGSDFLGSLRDSACSAIVLDPLQPKGAASVLDGLEKEELEDGRVRFNELPALRRLFHCQCQGREGLRFMDSKSRRATWLTSMPMTLPTCGPPQAALASPSSSLIPTLEPYSSGRSFPWLAV